MTFRLYALIVLIVVLVGGGAFLVWGALGQANQSARLSDLLSLRISLLASARTEGRYPADLSKFAADPNYSRWLAGDTLEYVASGQLYVERSDQILFRERQSHRYGWVRGWFEISHDGWVFHKGNRAPAASGSQPGIGSR